MSAMATVSQLSQLRKSETLEHSRARIVREELQVRRSDTIQNRDRQFAQPVGGQTRVAGATASLRRKEDAIARGRPESQAQES